MDKKDEFKIAEHGKMIENMNQISTHLQNFYWYFLASIAAVGVAYKTILGKDLNLCQDQKRWLLLGACLVGNIVFWLIGEYAISHGFLFRFVQAKAARVEKEVWNSQNSLIKDPTDISEYIHEIDGKNRFYLDHVLPDQFVPIYWSSFWLIALNAAIVFFLIQNVVGFYCWLWTFAECLLISLPLISKLWSYYISKIKRLFKDLKIEVCTNGCSENMNDKFFNFPCWIILISTFFGLLFHLIKIIIQPWEWLRDKLSLELQEDMPQKICLKKFPYFCKRMLFLIHSVT